MGMGGGRRGTTKDEGPGRECAESEPNRSTRVTHDFEGTIATAALHQLVRGSNGSTERALPGTVQTRGVASFRHTSSHHAKAPTVGTMSTAAGAPLPLRAPCGGSGSPRNRRTQVIPADVVSAAG